jgi:hypothetical protein
MWSGYIASWKEYTWKIETKREDNIKPDITIEWLRHCALLELQDSAILIEIYRGFP